MFKWIKRLFLASTPQPEWVNRTRTLHKPPHQCEMAVSPIQRPGRTLTWIERHCLGCEHRDLVSISDTRLTPSEIREAATNANTLWRREQAERALFVKITDLWAARELRENPPPKPTKLRRSRKSPALRKKRRTRKK